MKSVHYTDKGKVRQHNEDSVGVFSNKDGDCLAVVADGMGGHRAGDVASSLTINKFEELWKSQEKFTTADQAESWLRKNISEINREVYEHSQSNIECEGMGTTVVAAICTENFATVVNIGDSRGYILNESGFSQLTEDHSLVNELVRSGQISKEDAEHHPRKNVLLRALGTEEKVEMDTRTIIFEEDDILLLCSDGLSNKVSQEEMKEILSGGVDLDEIGKQFISLANENGGEDNITLAIVKYPSESGNG
ncbi:Stp1/IreP family PP2C-type Ser/Thr phosphatase [Rossellomorea vietnamensis]|uniref:protein-serine/threonine phosphatase n=2 Tax=Rossellomorea TaxID=2837508 RepID=A0A5D4KK00_9BACI|nr:MULTISPECIES: Stp1/IreP family PP2C-type Ser/Thr phosphatase [Rossellomorea]TYR77572.1 Stp1/IreP family PP2C-type Ser/Thr phosphatase [Rossellomorea vietnamensis]TYS77196.1 Stp1/IreP family PP2C-type Ser/Thr phosphatase [Rossellomorea aquimaris]